MSTLKSPRFLVMLLGVACGAILLQQLWHWEVERIEVPPGQFLVRIHRWGQDLDEDQIVAPDDSYKGVMYDVLPEGRHFLNPFLWSYEVHKVTDVPPGACLVLTRMFGDELPPGEILARENPENPVEGTRGILPAVLPPGRYRINPYAYQVERVQAVEIRADQVGVRTLKVGQDPATLKPEELDSPYVVPDGYRGVQRTPVAPGTYYINPHVESISPVEVRSHRVELSDIKFPSRDGFILAPHVVVEYAVRPESAPELLVRIAGQGILHQDDATPEEQSSNEILQKVILPHIRGYARIEGSNFDARDFILISSDDTAGERQNAREALQQALFAKVKPQCEDLGVELRAVTLAALTPPAELSEQISQRELARVEQEKNAARLRELQAEQELKAKEALKQQANEKVQAETKLVQGKTQAEQMLEVETARLVQELENAQLQLDAALLQVEATLAKGKAEAAVIEATNQAEVAGLRTAIAGFRSIQDFAQYQIVSKLSPALSEIFASDQSEFARIFAHYMTQPEGARLPLRPAAAAAPEGPSGATSR